jgi:hypothetical protein
MKLGIDVGAKPKGLENPRSVQGQRPLPRQSAPAEADTSRVLCCSLACRGAATLEKLQACDRCGSLHSPHPLLRHAAHPIPSHYLYECSDALLNHPPAERIRTR